MTGFDQYEAFNTPMRNTDDLRVEVLAFNNKTGEDEVVMHFPVGGSGTDRDWLNAEELASEVVNAVNVYNLRRKD